MGKRLIFITEARFAKDQFGNIYGDPAFDLSLWERYLVCFDKVSVLARIENITDVVLLNGKISIPPNKVFFLELPYYVGPLNYLRKRNSIKKAVKKIVKENIDSKFICRVPGIVSDLVIKELNIQNKKYALEVVGDPDDVFAPGVIKHPLRFYFRYQAVSSLKRNVKKASSVLYVTKEVLQKKYPSEKNVFHTYASNVMLADNLVSNQSLIWKKKSVYKILCVGSLAQMYKSPDIVIKAIKYINKINADFKCELIWLGDGYFLEEMKQLVVDLKQENSITFLGSVSREIVLDFMKSVDLFVLASRTEGLPRVVVEAMGQGVPCVGTKVGGIPELLDENALVDKDDEFQLALKIIEMLENESVYNFHSKRNLSESLNYVESVLVERRKSFYNYIISNL